MLLCASFFLRTSAQGAAVPLPPLSVRQVPRGASKSKPLRYEVSQRELEEMMREQG